MLDRVVTRSVAKAHWPIQNPAVAKVFSNYPAAIRGKMLALRTLILETAAAIPAVGPLEETLKWGEPAYLTAVSKSGSTMRIDSKPSDPNRYAVYFPCQTNLIETFRTLFPNEFTFEGNRAIVFELDDRLPIDALRTCVAAALTYHSAKRKAHR